MRELISKLGLALLAFSLISNSVIGAEQTKKKKTGSIIRYDSIQSPVVGRRGMVVSQRRIASEIGAAVLAKGGNAVDAAVAVGFALSVLLPRAGNIGGGGFMLVYLAEQDVTVTIDYRETAPSAAHKDMYLDGNGEVNRNLYRSGIKSAAVPGTVAGLSYALEKYGTLSLSEVLAPAIELAANGFSMDYDTASAIVNKTELLHNNAAAKAAYFQAYGKPYLAGDHFVQADLASSLRSISKQGASAFYAGPIADKIIATMRKSGGVMTHKDLANYQPIERRAIVGSYRGYKIVSMPPPSSGGVHIVQMLNILENFDLSAMGSNTAESLHVTAEAMRYAYADRSRHLGDPDFYKVPIDWLTSKDYAKSIAQRIDRNIATASVDVAPGQAPPYESVDTTHFSVVDRDGNAVSNTYTLNFSFGSGVMVEGAGFLLNNEMTDFNAKSGSADAFGLIGGTANSIQAMKRPLSAMTPTMVFKDEKLFLVTGSPGGSRIINTVLQQIINVIDFNMNIASATHAPRIHHQWQPDQLQVEASTNPDSIEFLKQKGHKVITGGTMGSLQSILIQDDVLQGAADPRRPGAGAISIEMATKDKH